ncbi:FtsK/SpoIIIE domain-containing protein [Streptomyces sp. URMC 123]|uniref:FtsK/SpoIIIE domain-containing protein n=1 Tax=Streptomyces sp. URMC 123 TaxID=3423403 RepID=UPI003F1AC796
MRVLTRGTGRARGVASSQTVDGVPLHDMPFTEARRTARAPARFEDPELRVESAGLPDRVSLLPLLSLEDTLRSAVRDHWVERAPGLRARAVLGWANGTVPREPDNDGPHTLIAGTTGSGKSESLGTLIASMAVDADPVDRPPRRLPVTNPAAQCPGTGLTASTTGALRSYVGGNAHTYADARKSGLRGRRTDVQQRQESRGRR